jgi:hypothetical protein
MRGQFCYLDTYTEMRISLNLSISIDVCSWHIDLCVPPPATTMGLIYGESYGCGVGIVGGRVGGWGIANEGGADCVIRNGSKDGLAASSK